MASRLLASRLLAALLALAALAASAAAARAEGLVVSLSSHHVRITQTYTGAELVIFGVITRDRSSIARQGPYDIVITAKGPQGLMVVREKVRFGPIWANLEQRKFGALPVTIAVLATRPISEITTPDLRIRYGIGLEALIPKPGFGSAEDVPFRDALIRLRREAGLYVEREDAVTFVTPDIFRAPVPVPSTAPVGTYEVSIALLADGVQIARETTNFEVSKAGFEQVLYQSAKDRPWLYGSLTAMMALTMGWLASVVFRRD
ncbi:MAG: TIGR02186 family protein [Burkholderiales bacterium]|nr:TIGR02186 family protein [Burkholderiales bacterium]